MNFLWRSFVVVGVLLASSAVAAEDCVEIIPGACDFMKHTSSCKDKLTASGTKRVFNNRYIKIGSGEYLKCSRTSDQTRMLPGHTNPLTRLYYGPTKETTSVYNCQGKRMVTVSSGRGTKIKIADTDGSLHHVFMKGTTNTNYRCNVQGILGFVDEEEAGTVTGGVNVYYLKRYVVKKVAF